MLKILDKIKAHILIICPKNKVVHAIKSIRKHCKLNLHTVLITLSALGILGLFNLVYLTSRSIPSGQPITSFPKHDFKEFIASQGIIEASSDNVNLGCQINGLVKEILVKVGDKVKTGDPIFILDQQQAQADVVLKQQQLEQAKAALKQAEATMNSSKVKYEIAKKISDKRAISQDDFLNRENAYTIDKAAYANAQEALKVAEAQLKVSQTNLDMLTVRAPFDADILKINIHPGEYATSSKDLIMLGKVDHFQVRIDIDENEAWRYHKGAQAIMYIRGNAKIKFDLIFDRIEPYVLPKISLTGDSTERVDVRVLQVIYQFKSDRPNVYIGQQVDVYINVPDSKDRN